MKFFWRKNKNKKGSALALTMFILAGMLIVAMSGSYIILIGLKASGVQSQSTKAYYAAESGAENVLWRLRKSGWKKPIYFFGFTPNYPLYINDLSLGSRYYIYYIYPGPIIFTSVGEFNQTKRSIELRM